MGIGSTTVKVAKVVELIKRVLADIHISLDIIGVRFEETYKPLYEGLTEVKKETHIPGLKASFSFTASKVNTLPGY
jgi:hypothetical protein